LHEKILIVKNAYSILIFESKVISIKNLIFVERIDRLPLF
jgi:hypothetical protein